MDIIQKAVETRSFNITDSVHELVRCAKKGKLSEAREIIQDMKPPDGYNEACLPVTRYEYPSVRLVIRHNPSVVLIIIDKD